MTVRKTKQILKYNVSEEDPQRIVQVTGFVQFGGVVFRATLNPCNETRYALRGQICALSPDKGVMKITGSARKKIILEKLDGRDPTTKEADQYLCIRRSVRIKSDAYTASNRKTIETYLVSCAKELYGAHIDTIIKALQESALPDQITPIAAYQIYIKGFLSYESGKVHWAASTVESYQHKLFNLFSSLDPVPMCKSTTKHIEKICTQLRVSSTTQRMAWRFWQYCIDSGYCTGSNPVPAPLKKRKNAKQLQKAAQIPKELNERQQSQLYDLLLSRAATDSTAVGTALLWSGFAPNAISELRWHSVICCAEDPDYVRIEYHVDDNAGATHDYTRPVLVQTARVLQARKAALLQSFDADVLDEMPVVGQKSAPVKPVSKANIVKNATDHLKQAGISEQTFAALKNPNSAAAKQLLLNTYKYNITNHCGLQEEPGTRKYLLGQSLIGDVTSDHYTSYTDPHGQQYLYRFLRRLMPDESIEVPPSEILDDTEVRYFAPTSTMRRVDFDCTLLLQPGQLVYIQSSQMIAIDITAEVV